MDPMEEAHGIRVWIRDNRTLVDAIGIAALSVLFAAIGVNGVWDLFSILPAPVSPWWSLALALPGCVLVLVKRRAPLTALAAASVLFLADLVTVGGIGPLVVLLDVLWTAVSLASPVVRRRILAALVIAVVATFAAVLLLTEAKMQIVLLATLQVAAIFGTDYWWAVAVSQANELADLHRTQAEIAARAAERDRTEAVRDEREAMARELHDLVAGHVLAMAIRTEAALSTEPDEQRDRAALQAVRDTGLQAHQALRSMIAVLREGDGEFTAPPGLADVDGMVEEGRRAGLRVTVQRDGLEHVPVPVAQTAARVVREALSNCVRHAAGAEVVVLLGRGAATTPQESAAVRAAAPETRRAAPAGAAESRSGEHDGAVTRPLRVRVTSRGGRSVAQPELSGSGWGLSLLAERVRALGGTFAAGADGDGWSVQAEFPIEVLR